MASLFNACKTIVRNNASDTLNIGGYDIGLELYHQSDIDEDVQYGDVAFGDNDESKIVVVAGDTITIPTGYTLTPDKPKKSLVIMCNNLVNNGTISMYQKAPNVLPHDYFILESSIAGTARDIIIPAYANNQVARQTPKSGSRVSVDGNNGTNRNCGSGGTGSGEQLNWGGTGAIGASGSGYAFGGGAGSGGSNLYKTANSSDVNSTYPMRASDGGVTTDIHGTGGGVGNPQGTDYTGDSNSNGKKNNNFGCGGRIIIFCNNFTNNGTITVNGTASKITTAYVRCYGGASGAGAVDLFYTNLDKQGTITANGGASFSYGSGSSAYGPGKGGNGSITLTQWTQTKLVKEVAKYFSYANVDYLLTQIAERIKDSRMGE